MRCWCFMISPISDEQQLAFSRSFGGDRARGRQQHHRGQGPKAAGRVARMCRTSIGTAGCSAGTIAGGCQSRQSAVAFGQRVPGGAGEVFDPVGQAGAGKGGNTEFADMPGRPTMRGRGDQGRGRGAGAPAFADVLARAARVHRVSLGGRRRRSGRCRSRAGEERHPVSGRKSLFLASHAGAIEGWPVPEARAFLRDLSGAMRRSASSSMRTIAAASNLGDVGRSRHASRAAVPGDGGGARHAAPTRSRATATVAQEEAAAAEPRRHAAAGARA